MSEQPLFDVGALKKLDAKPGDTFLLTVPDETPIADAEIMCELASRHLNGAKVIDIHESARLEKWPIKFTSEYGKHLATLLIEAQRVLMRYVRYDPDNKPDSQYLPNRLLRAAMELDPAADQRGKSHWEGEIGENPGQFRSMVCVPKDLLFGGSYVAALSETAGEPKRPQSWRERPPML